MPNNDFAPFQKKNTVFVVRNITSPIKVVRIFHYPINPGDERDLLDIPGVDEADIRGSLLKGEIQHKLAAKEIIITKSDIDLLQFNTLQKTFLINNGLKIGHSVLPTMTSLLRREDEFLIGSTNGVNRTFFIPDSQFIFDPLHTIIVYKNGVKEVMIDDYLIFESGGPGTGYNGVIYNTAPLVDDVLTADYYINQP